MKLTTCWLCGRTSTCGLLCFWCRRLVWQAVAIGIGVAVFLLVVFTLGPQ